MEENLVLVTASPHVRAKRTTRGIMLDVLIALLPALFAAGWHFGWRAGLVCAVSVGSCVLLEYISRKVMKRENTIGDLSAIVTGLLLAFNLPATLPLWMVPIGAAAAIVVTKQMFGGLGQNFANPAIVGRIVLMLSFTTAMTSFPKAGAWLTEGADAVASATPMKEIGTLAKTAAVDGSFAPQSLPTLLQMFLGERGGSLGETCGAALLLGFVYLLLRKVVNPLIPCCFVGTVFLGSLLYSGNLELAVYEVLGGGLLLGAIFMATDYVTSPIHWKGRIVFGVGCGLITVVIRFFGNMPEGVSFAILLMNLLSPLIENLTAPKAFGEKEYYALEAQREDGKEKA
ncbi:MAG: RnfABCDGE type electron transport complex subunit D [Oscillospiraceae bacterium]|jgi:electron transport complex protein RnfD|nr:RnfABCDGE type electron transport complex subunit D [Oscillospiraceae bacterium]